MSDPRLAAVRSQLAGVRQVIAVTGGKGGIGKSLVSSTLALELAHGGKSAGLLDLDLTAPCDHLILGFDGRLPAEEFGIEPHRVAGLRFMSVTSFIGEDPAPLRGVDVSNALIELLAITRWGELDVLVVDMPPGLGDAMLDAVRLIDRADHLVVATDSRVVLQTVRRTVRLLRRTGSRLAGVVENMRRSDADGVERFAGDLGLRWLGALPFDGEVEGAMGDPAALRETTFAEALREVIARLRG